MKKFLFVLIMAASCLAWDTSFCDGWDSGYTAGYCYGKQFCMPPMVPMCPMPHLGKDTYQDGYNRGFLAGLNTQRR